MEAIIKASMGYKLTEELVDVRRSCLMLLQLLSSLRIYDFEWGVYHDYNMKPHQIFYRRGILVDKLSDLYRSGRRRE